MRYLPILIALLFISCNREKLLEVKNPIDKDRLSEVVCVDLAKLPEYQNSNILVNGKDVPYQLLDSDKDGNSDKLLFLANFKANDNAKLSFGNRKNKLQDSKMVNVRFGEKHKPYREIHDFKRVKKGDSLRAADLFLMEGPAWENDKIAFRNYYDERNGMDIFGKRTNKMVLDSVGIEGTNYHKISDWGMDILKVGNSLGAGAIALKINDTVFPVRNIENSFYKLTVEGQLFAEFQLIHKNCKLSDRTYDITHTISIYAGTQFYNSKVEIKGLKGDEKLVTGIVNLHSDSLYLETVNNEEFIFATYDKQAENKANLGMGIMVNKKYYPKVVSKETSAKGIENTYMVEMNIDKNKSAEYRFYAAWETADTKYGNLNGFLDLLKEDAVKKLNPIELAN